METQELLRRRNERNSFLEDYVAKAYQKMTQTGDNKFMFSLSENVIRWIKKEDCFKGGYTSSDLFFHQFLLDIDRFSRSKEERETMMVLFFGKLAVSGVSSYLRI